MHDVSGDSAVAVQWRKNPAWKGCHRFSDPKYSGFPKKFQGRQWADAIVEYQLGYKVELTDLRPGDIISKPGHRMVVLKPLASDEKGRPRILTIEAKPPAGSAIKRQQRTVKKGWEAARIFDRRT